MLSDPVIRVDMDPGEANQILFPEKLDLESQDADNATLET